jgi:hypothetical protein
MEFATIGYILDWIMSNNFKDGVQTSLLYDFEKKSFCIIYENFHFSTIFQDFQRAAYYK